MPRPDGRVAFGCAFRRVAWAAGALLAATIAPPAAGAVQRTFVASTGSDANPCTITLPCRSFGVAITQTPSGGEILVRDSAGYGPVTIAKSLSIISPDGVYAGVTVPAAADGIVVDAPGITVDLRGLVINGLGARYGIWLKNGSALELDSVRVSGNQVGLYATATNSATLIRRSVFTRNSSLGIWFQNSFNVVRDTVVQRNGMGGGIDGGIRFEGYGDLNVVRSESSQNRGNGIVADDNASTGTMKVAIEASQFFGNVGHGIVVRSNDVNFIAGAEVARSASVGNAGDGIRVESYGPGGAAYAAVSDTTVSDNKSAGIRVIGGAAAALTRNMIMSNASYGIDQVGGPHVVSGGDSITEGNNPGGAQTSGTIFAAESH